MKGSNTRPLPQSIMDYLFDIPNILTSYGYLGVFVIVFLESGIFFALPGDSLLFTAGILASGGILDIYTTVLIIFISTFLGGVFGYYVGIHLEKLRRFSFTKKILKEEHMAMTHQFFEKHGKSAIIFSRFVPIARTFAPIVAGMAKMNYISFLKYSLISSISWSTIVTLSGYFLGQSFPWIKDYMPIVILIVVFLSLLPPIFEIVRKKHNS